ncbi:3-oxoacyl-ACP synthase [Eubacterium sp. An11]|uniref:beta-ketoacyl-ACP synthase III n=1 Tax=Eubacterium sp. An11 TaxID=1965542 RepID=UPI000B375BE6|nr:beta-ketoacyl-ACP synthase III [Eubacterium sp. An11]OUQ70362.1 3-oxoacyl-ACP synthase [Eubacterium sp. An11]
MFVKIAGTGSFLPERVVDNFEIARMVDTSDEWIQTRTGIRTRHIATDETVAGMATEAAKRAVENAGITPEEIDLIIVSTVSAEQSLPCVACEVQKALGAKGAAALDVNSACSGFITGYQMAAGQIKAGLAKTALVIGSECLSNYVDWTDRGTCILFGDGAGAAILKADCAPEDLRIPCVLHADGSKGDSLTCSLGHGKNKVPYDEYYRMDGRAIFKFAVKKVPEVIHEVLDLSGHTVEEIDYFILHQANKRIIDAIAKRLRQDESKFPMNIMDNGNISSACIPMLLDDMNRKGLLKPGMKLVLAGFGAGLTWGGFYLEW